MGGQCVQSEHVWLLLSCGTTSDCELDPEHGIGYVCRQIAPPIGPPEGWCIWWYDVFAR
jgi:hypothetical protein